MNNIDSKLIQDLLNRIDLLEKKIDNKNFLEMKSDKKKKENKKEKEDKEKIEEALGRIGGIGSIVKNSQPSDLIEKTIKKLTTDKLKKKLTEQTGDQLPPEAMISLLRNNKHEDPEDSRHYPLLPDHVHSSVIGLVDDFLDYSHPNRSARTDQNISDKIKRAQQALSILQKNGLSKHPATFIIDQLKQKLMDTDQSAAFRTDRSMGRHNPGYWNVV